MKIQSIRGIASVLKEILIERLNALELKRIIKSFTLIKII